MRLIPLLYFLFLLQNIKWQLSHLCSDRPSYDKLLKQQKEVQENQSPCLIATKEALEDAFANDEFFRDATAGVTIELRTKSLYRSLIQSLSNVIITIIIKNNKYII